MLGLLLRFVRDQSGATAIEYSLIASGIALAIITIVGAMGGQLVAKYTVVSTKLG